MTNDQAAPEPDVGLIILRTGKDLLDDLWTLYRGELQRMPAPWASLTEDEREEIEVRAFATFENVVNAMAYRAATAAIAKGRPWVLGTLDVVKLADDAQIVVKAKVDQPGLHALIGRKGAGMLVVLTAEAETVHADAKVDDKTPDMFDGGVVKFKDATGGGVTVGDAPAPQPEPQT